MALLEKSKLKDTIKKYESEFTKATGRALSKEDREYHKDDFEKYKVANLYLHFTLFIPLSPINVFFNSS